ncbi:MAG: sulfite exporter TauE/SafE family protein [Planctomycetota bacterium]
MMTLLGTVFVASFLGSLHCAGMCGGVVAFVAGTPGQQGASRTQVAYHFGRLLSYSIIGLVAGGFGAVLDLGGEAVGLGRFAIVLAGSVMIAYGVILLLRVQGRQIKLPVPAFLQRFYQAGFGKVTRLTPTLRGGALGMLTALLPCGWLYLFAAGAAATGHPLWGALSMAVFWAGTVPVLAALGVGVKKLSGPLQRHVPSFSAVLLVVVGLMAVLGRLDVPSFAAAAEQGHDTPACCEPAGS